MAKPIFLARLPKGLPFEHIQHFYKTMESRLLDYHILVISGSSQEAQFECFYDKDLKETDFEEFKKHVLQITQPQSA